MPKMTAETEWRLKEREVLAIRRDISKACKIIRDGLLRYKAKKLKSRSLKQAHELLAFGELADYGSKQEIQDAYGWNIISRSEMERLLDLWDVKEEKVKADGKYEDRVTLMLERAMRNCAEPFQDTIDEFEELKRLAG